MARRKVPMGLIASRRVRAATYAKRKEGLRKKAQELATLCDVPVALVCDAGGEGRPEVWESREGVLAAYRALPAEARAGHTLRAYAEAELGKEAAKLARVRQAGPPELAPWDAALDGYAHEDLRRLLASLDAALRAVEERRRALGMPLHDGDDVGAAGGGLLEGVVSDAVPLARVGADFADGADGYSQLPPGCGAHADDGGYRQAMWGDGFLQSGCGFHQCTTTSGGVGGGGGGGVDMDVGYQLQMAPDVYGTSSSSNNNGRRLAWEDFQPRNNAGAVQLGYSLHRAGSSYAAMDGYHTQQGVPGVHPNLAIWSTGEPCNAVVPSGHLSLDIGLGYMDTSAGQHAAVGAGGSFVNSPPALSLAMGTGDDFASAPPALPLAMSFAGDVANPGGYVTRWPDRQLQRADGSRHSSLEQLHYLSDLDDPQLHYLSDMEDAKLQLWGANPPPMPAPHHSSKN
ncbi:hypothetical protein ACP4OV_020726 [Aristida adscensionis]